MLLSKGEIEEIRETNREERMRFVRFWANYVRTHPDEDWSQHQNQLIDPVLETASTDKELYLNRKRAINQLTTSK